MCFNMDITAVNLRLITTLNKHISTTVYDHTMSCHNIVNIAIITETKKDYALSIVTTTKTVLTKSPYDSYT